MDKRFLGILGAIIIIFVAIFAITQSSNNNNSSSGNGNGGNNNSNSSQGSNNVEGQNKKNITLVEWGDFECPVCGEYYQPLKVGLAKYLPDIHFQFRNLPLTSLHPNAFAAARAAQAAALQGKFWQMHDKLYENQNAWAGSPDPLSMFSTYAKQAGLNVAQFKTDYASSKVNDVINADLSAFDKTGQQHATPTFFLNGKYIDNSKLVDAQSGAPTAAAVGNFIKAEIAKKP